MSFPGPRCQAAERCDRGRQSFPCLSLTLTTAVAADDVCVSVTDGGNEMEWKLIAGEGAGEVRAEKVPHARVSRETIMAPWNGRYR